MDSSRGDAAELRAETNTSLSADRIEADDSSDRATVIARRVLDDLIERDRIAADARLVRFRSNADTLLALERLATPTRDKALARERRMADEDKRAERIMTDDTLNRERHRVDERSDTCR